MNRQPYKIDDVLADITNIRASTNVVLGKLLAITKDDVSAGAWDELDGSVAVLWLVAEKLEATGQRIDHDLCGWGAVSVGQT